MAGEADRMGWMAWETGVHRVDVLFVSGQLFQSKIADKVLMI